MSSRLEQSLGVRQIKINDRLLGNFHTVARERLTLDLVSHVTRVVVFPMTGQAQDGSDDQLRRATCSRALHRATDYIQTICKIGSIDRVTFESVTRRAINQIMTSYLAVVWRGISIMIVRRDDNERHLFDSGYVHSFVERAGLHTAFADARQADKVFLTAESFRHQRAHRHRNHRAEVTDHSELIVARPAPVNIAVSSTHGALPRAEISARDVEQWFAECGSPCLVANQWREDVAFLQKQTASHADRFLALADVNAARDQTAAVETNELFFESAREQHPTKALVRPGLRPCGFFAPRRCFKHSGILPKFDNRAQIFFRLPNSLWVAHASLIAQEKVRDREMQSPARETRALP